MKTKLYNTSGKTRLKINGKIRFCNVTKITTGTGPVYFRVDGKIIDLDDLREMRNPTEY